MNLKEIAVKKILFLLLMMFLSFQVFAAECSFEMAQQMVREMDDVVEACLNDTLPITQADPNNPVDPNDPVDPNCTENCMTYRDMEAVNIIMDTSAMVNCCLEESNVAEDSKAIIRRRVSLVMINGLMRILM